MIIIDNYSETSPHKMNHKNEAEGELIMKWYKEGNSVEKIFEIYKEKHIYNLLYSQCITASTTKL